MGQGTFPALDVYDNRYRVLYRALCILQSYRISRSHHRHTLEALVLKDPDYKRGLLYLLPSFICGISAALIYATISNEDFSEFIGYHYYFQNYDSISGPAWWLVIIHRAFRIIIAVEIPLVLYFGWKYINEYNRMVENYYSNTEDKVVTFIKPLMIAFLVSLSASFISNFVNRNYFGHSCLVVLFHHPVVRLRRSHAEHLYTRNCERKCDDGGRRA